MGLPSIPFGNQGAQSGLQKNAKILFAWSAMCSTVPSLALTLAIRCLKPQDCRSILDVIVTLESVVSDDSIITWLIFKARQMLAFNNHACG